MKKKTLRVISLVVALVMLLSLLPLSALANETGPKRKVGVVVYGAELTTVLTDVESAFQGDVDLKESLQKLTDMTSKLVDGTGISVPEVDVQLTDENGRVYTMEEDKTIEIFTDTTELYIGFQDEVDKQLTKLEGDSAGLRQAMKDSNQMTSALATQLDQFDAALADLRQKMNDLKDTLIGGFNDMEVSPNGILYRTYVTTEEVPVGTYTAYVAGFSDTDEDGNAITRDGYVLYNDGLDSDGSMFNTTRTFSVDVKEKGRFDHEVQFVGPLAGIQGELQLPDAFNTAYDTFAGAMNTMLQTAEKLKNAATGNNVTDWAAGLLTDLTDTKPIYEWFKNWTAPEFSTSDQISKAYRFGFPGLWCAEYDAGFTFKSVDAVEAGIAGAEYLLVNRQELLDVLKFMKELGKDAFEGALKATFGGTATYADGTVMTYEGITDLYAQLLDTEGGQLSLDYDTAYAIVKTYIGVIGDMNLFDRVVVVDGLDTHLRYPIPAILKTTSDENGLVAFTKNTNITLTWILEIIPQIMDFAADKISEDNQVLQLLKSLAEYATKMTEDFTDLGAKLINTLVYPFAQRLGLVGKKLASGEYILFQTKAPDGYYRNPLAYTMILSWDNETWLYVTVADLGLIGPYFAEGFYDFVRNTTFSGTIDKFLGELTGKTDFDLVTQVLNGKIDLTDETNQTMMAALTAFVGTVGFDSLGLDTIFSTRTDFIAGLNDYLYKNGKTAQNLMVYVNQQAKKAKAVYAGYVDEDWYFYNLDKSPTVTATKLIQKSTNDIADAIEVDAAKTVVQKTGDTLNKAVNTVGTKVESAADSVKQKVQATVGNAVKSAVQSVAQRVLSNAKTTVSNFFSKLFNR